MGLVVGGATPAEIADILGCSPKAVYTWVLRFDVNSSGLRFEGRLEIEVEGDLAKRIEWLGEGFEEIGPALGS